MSKELPTDPSSLSLVKAFALGKAFCGLGKIEKTLEEADCSSSIIYQCLEELRADLDRQIKLLPISS